MQHTAFVTHFEIGARDPASLKRFYRGLFGWQTGFDGAISAADGSRVTCYVEVDDVLENLSYAEELGGRIIELPHEIVSAGRRVTVAAFADPEGNRIGLSNGFSDAQQSAA